MTAESELRVKFVDPVRVVWPENQKDVSASQMTLDDELVLDFGTELFGGIELAVERTDGVVPVRVAAHFGESVAEVFSKGAVTRRINVTCSGQYSAATTDGDGNLLDERMVAYRFVRIRVLDTEQPHLALRARAISRLRSVDRLGSFACNDELLNQIWLAGARTVHLCMQDRLWDGIKRDRSVWMGDLHTAGMVVSCVFGEHSVVAESMDHVRDSTLDDGHIHWMNGIPCYSLWWIILQHQWYLYHGNHGYLEAQRPYLRSLLPKLFASIDDRGRERLDGWRFFDWATQDATHATHGGYQGLMILALQAGSELCNWLGEDGLRGNCRTAIDQLRRHRPRPGNSKQARALLALAGLCDLSKTNEAYLRNQPTSGLTPFLGYQVLQARAMAGDVRGGLDLTRSYWGAMLQLGATTFWEDFDIEWTSKLGRIDQIPWDPDVRDFFAFFGRCPYTGSAHSLCHGWSSGPTAWLTEHVLGIKPTKPGCAKVRIQPQLGDLLWAEGTLPSPHGAIVVRHERAADGELNSQISLPDGVELDRV